MWKQSGKHEKELSIIEDDIYMGITYIQMNIKVYRKD